MMSLPLMMPLLSISYCFAVIQVAASLLDDPKCSFTCSQKADMLLVGAAETGAVAAGPVGEAGGMVATVSFCGVIAAVVKLHGTQPSVHACPEESQVAPPTFTT